MSMTFVPSDDQRVVRSKARRLYEQGHRLIGEICSQIPELTIRRWREWEKQRGFLDWWIELFPEHSEMCMSDLRALEYEANKALMGALVQGDLTAVGLVVKMIGLAQAREEVSVEDDAWFSDSSDGDWLPPVIADA